MHNVGQCRAYLISEPQCVPKLFIHSLNFAKFHICSSQLCLSMVVNEILEHQSNYPSKLEVNPLYIESEMSRHSFLFQ